MPAKKSTLNNSDSQCELFGCERNINRILTKVPRTWVNKIEIGLEDRKRIPGYRCNKCKKILCRYCVYNTRIKKCAFCSARMNGTSKKDDKEMTSSETSNFMEDEAPTSSFPYGVSRDYSPISAFNNSPESIIRHFFSDRRISSGNEKDDNSTPRYSEVNQSPSGSSSSREEGELTGGDELQFLKVKNQSLETELERCRKRIKEMEDYITAIERSNEENVPKKRAKITKQ